MPGKERVCKLCVFRHEQDGIRAKEQERRKAREATRVVVNLKTSQAEEILKNTNPFNYNQMMKLLKDKNLMGFLKKRRKRSTSARSFKLFSLDIRRYFNNLNRQLLTQSSID
jgi:hypothetical protein